MMVSAINARSGMLVDLEGDEWIRLANGDLILGVFPCGETYFDIEKAVEADWTNQETVRP